MAVDLDVLQAKAAAEGRRCAVGALVRDGRGRVFVHRRGEHRALLPGCWDIPGGHVEAGESLADALRREVAEETGWQVVGDPQLIFVSDWETNSDEDPQPRREFDFLVDVEGDLSRPRLERPAHVEAAWVDHANLDLLDENRAAEDGLVRRVVSSALYWPLTDQPAYPHATVYLDGPAVAELKRLRRRWDPVMADAIAAHMTVGYPRDVSDLQEMRDHTRTAAEHATAGRIALGPVKFDREHGTVFVAVDDLDGTLGVLRRHIVGRDGSAMTDWIPHVTLVHPRTTNRGPDAWAELGGRVVRGDFRVSDVHVTALRDADWESIAIFPLSGEGG